jgi:hypothetical protein
MAKNLETEGRFSEAEVAAWRDERISRALNTSPTAHRGSAGKSDPAKGPLKSRVKKGWSIKASTR